MIIANNRQPQSDDYKPWFLWRYSRKGKGPEKSRFDNRLARVDAGRHEDSLGTFFRCSICWVLLLGAVVVTLRCKREIFACYV